MNKNYFQILKKKLCVIFQNNYWTYNIDKFKKFLIKELNKRLDNETILTKNNLNFVPANLCGYFIDAEERSFKIKQIIYQILLVMIKIILMSNAPEIMDIFNNINAFDFF